MFLFFVYWESNCSKFIHQIVNCLSAANSFITKFMSTFLLTLSSRSIFHIDAIQKYTLLWSIRHHDVPHCLLIVTENKLLMELITAVYCWQIIGKFLLMNCTACRETYWRQVVHKLIASFHSKRYRPSGMLIHQQNVYVPHDQQCTGCHELQNHEPVSRVEKSLC
jgi:hypothetical protein